MQPMTTTVLSLILLAAGGVALIIMMAQFGGRQIAHPQFAALLHRMLGWLFTALYLMLMVVMVRRLDDYWEVAPARIAIHVSLAVLLFLLLAIKVSVHRIFPGLAKHLLTFGIAVYLTAFVLVGITAGYFLLRLYQGVPYISHTASGSQVMDLNLGEELFINKCGTCHLIRDIATPRSPKEWEGVVNRMVRLASPRIIPAAATQILNYLVTKRNPVVPREDARLSAVQKYCAPCHAIGEIKKRIFDRNGWEDVVRRMRERAPEIIPENEINSIINELVQRKY
ncbi:MAG: hypothetical protein M0024_14815 [Nitrospiraceae bacterium]|nr:hypothetical protein [Nitrospiraceae bacterium]